MGNCQTIEEVNGRIFSLCRSISEKGSCAVAHRGRVQERSARPCMQLACWYVYNGLVLENTTGAWLSAPSVARATKQRKPHLLDANWLQLDSDLNRFKKNTTESGTSVSETTHRGSEGHFLALHKISPCFVQKSIFEDSCTGSSGDHLWWDLNFRVSLWVKAAATVRLCNTKNYSYQFIVFRRHLYSLSCAKSFQSSPAMVFSIQQYLISMRWDDSGSKLMPFLWTILCERAQYVGSWMMPGSTECLLIGSEVMLAWKPSSQSGTKFPDRTFHFSLIPVCWLVSFQSCSATGQTDPRPPIPVVFISLLVSRAASKEVQVI